MTEHDDFLNRLRADARSLQVHPDDPSLTRMRANIRARVAARPTVLALLAAWFRPVAAAVAAVALAAAIGMAAFSSDETQVALDDDVAIVMGGETYSVGR